MTEDQFWKWIVFFEQKILSQLVDLFADPSNKWPSLIGEEKGPQLRGKYCRTTAKNQIKGTNSDW